MATLNLQVGAGADDAFSAFGSWLTTSGYRAGTSAQIDGYARFTGVSALNGSTVDSATFQLTDNGSSSGSSTTDLMAADQAGPSANSVATYDALPETTAQVAWDKSSWPGDGNDMDSPEIKTIIQELVDSHTMTAIVIMQKYDASGTGGFWAYDYDADSAEAPRLNITYTASSPQTVDMNHLDNAALNQPAVSPGGVAVNMNHLRTAQLFSPGATPGNVSVAMNHLATAGLDDPGVSQSGAIVGMNHLNESALNEGSVSPGGVIVNANHLNDSGLNQPGVNSNINVGMNHLSPAQLFQPAASPGIVVVAMDLLNPAGLFVPGMIYAVTVGMNHLSTAVLYQVRVSIVTDPARIPDGGGIPIVVFSHTKSGAIGLPATRYWNMSSTGEAGEFTALVPYESEVASNEYISKIAGSRIEVMDQSGSGTWRGYVTDVAYRPDGAMVTGIQQWGIVTRKRVPYGVVLKNYTAGEIVERALESTPLGIGGIVIGPPWIESYEFLGSYVSEIIAEMSDLTGYEFYIGDDGLANFGPRGSFNSTMLVAGGNLQDWSYEVNNASQVESVTARSGDLIEQVSERTSTSDWLLDLPIEIESDDRDVLYDEALAVLDYAKFPEEIISGSVAADLWSLREGDYIQAWIPLAQWEGVMRRLRVISRSLDDRAERMFLEFAVAQDIQPGQTGSINIPRLPPRRKHKSLVRELKRWRHEQTYGYSRHWIYRTVKAQRSSQLDINEDFESRISALEP